VRYAESELARLEADQAVLEGALAQARNDLAEASGVENFLPASADITVPVWENSGDSILPAQIALVRRESAHAQAEEARRALLPSLSLDASLFRNFGAGDSRDTWAAGMMISMPLGATAYRKADAQQLTARARAEQAEAARRDGERQLASLRAAYDAALADASAMEREVAYRGQVVQVQQEMARLGSQTLENLFRHERDLLDARYRLAQARARAAVAWSSAQVLLGTPTENYIARWEDQ
jgi:outer membrane protein TolC